MWGNALRKHNIPSNRGQMDNFRPVVSADLWFAQANHPGHSDPGGSCVSSQFNVRNEQSKQALMMLRRTPPISQLLRIVLFAFVANMSMEGDIPVGFEIHWKSVGMFRDRYAPPPITDITRDHAVTVAQGFPNGRHTLTLKSEGEMPTAIRAVRAYRPPLLD